MLSICAIQADVKLKVTNLTDLKTIVAAGSVYILQPGQTHEFKLAAPIPYVGMGRVNEDTSWTFYTAPTLTDGEEYVVNFHSTGYQINHGDEFLKYFGVGIATMLSWVVFAYTAKAIRNAFNPILIGGEL